MLAECVMPLVPMFCTALLTAFACLVTALYFTEYPEEV